MSERVGDRSLKKFFRRRLHRFTRRQEIVELLQRGQEALNFVFPRQRLGVMPFAFSVGHREPPIHQVAHVGENLSGSAYAPVGLKSAKSLGRIADSFASAISQ